MADAGQTGEDQTVTPTDTGEPTKDADAGQDTGGSDDNTVDPQAIHDRAFAEARRMFEGKIKDLESKLSERAEPEPPKKKKADDDEVVPVDELEAVKSEFQQQLEAERGRVSRAAEGWKVGKLIAALETAGIANPEYHAQVLKNRIKADLAEDGDEPFAAEVLTEKGGKALNPKNGEPMSIGDLASTFAADHPEFVRSKSRDGIGYSGAGTGAVPKSLESMSEQEKIDFIDKHGREEWDKLVHQTYRV